MLALFITISRHKAIAQKDERHFTHNLGVTNAVHYDLLKEGNNVNKLNRQDHHVNWSFRLFYELNYKHKIALEAGLCYLANTTSNYKESMGDTIQRDIALKISRGVPQIFINTKFYPLKKTDGYFIGLGYTRIKANYESAATNPIFNHIDYYNTSAKSNFIVLMTGKEFRYKKIRGDIRLSYYQHIQYKADGTPPAIIFLDANFKENRSLYWYNAIELGVTFII
jgi:hypothetical protein